MNITEPTIQVGILSANEIEFVLNGTFASNGKNYSGKHKVAYLDGAIAFDNEYKTKTYLYGKPAHHNIYKLHWLFSLHPMASVHRYQR